MITPIGLNNYTHKNISPTFSSYNAKVYKDGKLAYRNHTEFFRQDLDWHHLTDYMSEKYKDADEVNVVNHACSAGYESWSLLLMLMKKHGEKAEKYLPIKARDIDKNAIDFAKTGCLALCGDEYLDGILKCGKILNDNFKVVKKPRGPNVNVSNEYVMKCTTGLEKNIEFKQSDIFKDKNLINKENTVLFCRNFWPYLRSKKASELAFFLAQNMKPSSMLVIGEYDKTFGIDKLLEETGFKRTSVRYVYEAPDNFNKTKPVEFHMLRADLFA